MAKKPKQANAGRPKGSRNQEYPQSTGELTRCKKCGSTKREAYSTKTAVDHSGVRHGLTYTQVVFRNTKCRDCGQARIDQVYENNLPAKPKK